ncbi:MAG: UDP-N-acetylmuramoyl-L-alanine--D-glutamate ligase [Gammaproteobacteria bacterium]|nr:UDP-N-acetylmuramoyl-L-alanine--D-glutamate ligase [Gammaproteobacteria bacterium]MDH4310733.1 UDP-N-acetylmuramoyl-L-alanine--D-glutamate ligase [Gammaproteobacteria bacterium]MDH5272343.1 UDP-N-acetylmuramoyl-L-alanine--D-glutamate ligase [Gammaproteobacteria bacterium]
MTGTPHTLAPLAAGTRALVLGLGRTGLSAARYLDRKGLTLRVADTRANPPGVDALRADVPAAELRTGAFHSSLLDDVAQVVISPGLSLQEPVVREALERGLPVVGDIEFFAREARAPVAAVTGTNGKSTVTTLVAEIANAGGRRAVAGGNLGEPALDLLERPTPDLYVLELSSFQLETTHSLRTVTATVLNVTPDHMDRYASLAAYGAAKARIFDGCEVAVINADDPVVRDMPRPGQSVLSFSLESRDADFTLERSPAPMIVRRGAPLLPLAAMRLQGLHNAANAMAALAMAEALELPLAPALDALCAFAGLPHRSQWVADVCGVRYVNDSKGTNVGATLAAVQGMAGPLVVIAGGDGKNQDFSGLRAAFRGKVRHVVLIGRDAPALEATLAGVCATERASDMPAAVRAAQAVAQPGDTVLLSPACASLDMFRDYTHRGDEFAAAVRSLAA